MRAVGDESRPPCHKKKGSLLSREHPSKLFDSQDSVERKVVRVPLEATLERNSAGAEFLRVTVAQTRLV